ncbi:nucleotidyltransferase domain-containing protein [Candidatus Pacearchaeota archaeon]|nr:nucleotidyltransferase domain-containing protein [Candidatus Pacearchaeota archaeon]
MAGYFDSEVEEGEHTLLVSMFPKARDLTIKEIMKNSPYSSYERNNSYLKSLDKKKIIEEKKVGKTLTYSLISSNWHSKKAFHSYALERARKFLEEHKTVALGLKELPEEKIDFLAIFGSYAKGTEKKSSDIDLLCVTSKGKEIEKSISAIKRKFNLDVQAVIMPRTELGKIKKENIEFWSDLVNYGRIFIGYDLFYYYAYTT